MRGYPIARDEQATGITRGRGEKQFRDLGGSA
jgi:hypothetical protein